MHLHNFDSAVAHFCNEIEMVALGVVDPKDVVEQQCVAIAGGKTLMSAPWSTDHHFAQLTNLGMNAKLNLLRHETSLHYSHIVQIVM